LWALARNRIISAVFPVRRQSAIYNLPDSLSAMPTNANARRETENVSRGEDVCVTPPSRLKEMITVWMRFYQTVN
jgi:hypothetical protein